MKKENWKAFTAGVILTSVVMGAIPTLAEKVSKTAELFFNDIKIVVDGKYADLKDANGEAIEPFIIEGTTYLPVRAVSDALNKAVSWNGATQTVYLGQNEEIEQPSAWLNDLNTFTGEMESVVNTTGIYGKTLDVANDESQYQRYLIFPGTISHGEDDMMEASYLLNGKYKTFKTTLYLPEENKNYRGKANIYIYLDDALVYSSPDIQKGTLPIPVEIDTTNAFKLDIKCATTLEYDSKYFNPYQPIPLGNAGLYE